MQKKGKRSILFILLASLLLVLGACSNATDEEQDTNGKTENTNQGTTTNEEENEESSNGEEEMEGMDHAGMNHSGSSEVPEGLEEAENPTYPVGSKAIIHANHMPGMDGAEATISGAFDTTVYTVTYTPTTGGEPVEDHKWVIHEELENAGDESFQTGDEVVLNAEHMEGMKGATATIDSAEQTTVYMVDYTDTETGEKVTYHKWVTESELSPVE
ncbi:MULTISPECIES: YdhK family protein [Bacillaceae]|uniref:YdhK family protein n=1 Tax=Bacillaceae TaxID=186817 RepID=UPI00030D87C5|nr:MULTISPECIES: YdhK family protein [Bacillaceae]